MRLPEHLQRRVDDEVRTIGVSERRLAEAAERLANEGGVTLAIALALQSRQRISYLESELRTAREHIKRMNRAARTAGGS
jgi:hypothetical protein